LPSEVAKLSGPDLAFNADVISKANRLLYPEKE